MKPSLENSQKTVIGTQPTECSNAFWQLPHSSLSSRKECSAEESSAVPSINLQYPASDFNTFFLDPQRNSFPPIEPQDIEKLLLEARLQHNSAQTITQPQIHEENPLTLQTSHAEHGNRWKLSQHQPDCYCPAVLSNEYT